MISQTKDISKSGDFLEMFSPTKDILKRGTSEQESKLNFERIFGYS